ncbi:MAG: hypothetical protein WCF17_11120 [Terracidiphilus sp.]
MINRTRCALFPVAILLAAFTPIPLHAQMVNPSIDRAGEPFSYFSHPTDEIGILDSQAATEVTPEGYLRTGYGELEFFTGPEYEPINVRIRTLEQGHLPILHYRFQRDGIDFEITVFGTSLDLTHDGKLPDSGPSNASLVNFIRVEMKNTGTQPNRAIFTTGIRYDAPNDTAAGHGDNRFDRPREPNHEGGYRQLGEKFSPDWVYSYSGNSFFRDNRLLYSFPSGDAARSWTLHGDYNYPQDISKPEKLDVDPVVPVGIVTYSRLLKPGESWTLDYTMPVVPTSDPAQIAAFEHAGFDQAHAATVAFWNRILAQGMQLQLPEQKPVDTFYANLIYDLIARDRIGDDYIQTVNKLHYHAFFLRDGADIVHSYDVTGFPKFAQQDLEFFSKSQKPDGNFLSQEQQYDGWGEAVWGYSQHYRMTRDKAFAEWALPQIDRAVDWLREAREKDPLHIMPASDVDDNEDVPGHLTGYNFLALSGLKLAIQMAKETGHDDLAQKWQPEYDDYTAAFMKALDAQAAAHNGYIPPALDGQKGGYDWGNMLACDYELILPPHDPRVTATLRATQAKYKEGIMTYADGEFLHHYLTIKNTLNEVIRGDQEQATRELYALLLHTSSTHAGFEFAILPWGDRNFEDNLAPHGWFAAEYRTLLRNMLVREQGDELHLLSVLSPEWIGAGKTISVTQDPTYFGKVGFTLTQPSAQEAILKLDTQFDRAPSAIVVHIPWFAALQSAEVDGKPVQPRDGALTLPAGAKQVRLRWTMKPTAPRMSYDRAVAAYKAEYARRYNELMHGAPASAK